MNGGNEGMTSYFVIEKENQVINEGQRCFFLNDYGIRTPLENPPQNGFPAYYRQMGDNPARECDKAMYIDFLEKGVCAIKEQLNSFQRTLDKELSR